MTPGLIINTGGLPDHQPPQQHIRSETLFKPANVEAANDLFIDARGYFYAHLKVIRISCVKRNVSFVIETV